VTLQSVAKRYALALFDVVKKNGTVDAAYSGLSSFAALVDGSPELVKVFASPAVPTGKKRALAETLATQLGLSQEVSRALAAMGDRDRLSLVSSVAAAFESRVMQDRHVLQARVTTAVPLTTQGAEALAAALGRATGGTVKIDAHVDPSILGGVVARVGSTVFDGSVTRQLEIMKTQLINAQNK
jgi:F-type H+-transporting ATPase subunit delta